MSYGITDYIYECDRLSYDYRAYNLDDSQCPPMRCTRTNYDGSIDGTYLRESWWNDVADNETLCTEYCYCSPTEGKVCATGYSDIMANPKLLDEFMGDCGRARYSGAVV